MLKGDIDKLQNFPNSITILVCRGFSIIKDNIGLKESEKDKISAFYNHLTIEEGISEYLSVFHIRKENLKEVLTVIEEESGEKLREN